MKADPYRTFDIDVLLDGLPHTVTLEFAPDEPSHGIRGGFTCVDAQEEWVIERVNRLIERRELETLEACDA